MYTYICMYTYTCIIVYVRPRGPVQEHQLHGTRLIRATQTTLAEAMLADLRARAARACWSKCTGCTTKNWPYDYPKP